MLQKIDLASIAEEIESPYRPIPMASLEGLDVSLFISHGSKSWRRQAAYDQALFVIEGVIIIDGPFGKLVVNEGDLAVVPADVGHGIYSGMRSSIVLFEEKQADGSSNGHRSLPQSAGGGIERLSVAVDARAAPPFDWRACGMTGRYQLSATRLVGGAKPYQAPRGSLALLVHRGMLDFQTADESGSVVGSEFLVVPPDASLSFYSEHGATVLAAAMADAALPEPEGYPEATDGNEEGSAGG